MVVPSSWPGGEVEYSSKPAEALATDTKTIFITTTALLLVYFVLGLIGDKVRTFPAAELCSNDSECKLL